MEKMESLDVRRSEAVELEGDPRDNGLICRVQVFPPLLSLDSGTRYKNAYRCTRRSLTLVVIAFFSSNENHCCKILGMRSCKVPCPALVRSISFDLWWLWVV